jgi:hypothetical protein
MNELIAQDITQSRSKRSRSQSMHFSNQGQQTIQREPSKKQASSDQIFKLLITLLQENYSLSEDEMAEKVKHMMELSMSLRIEGND